MEKLTQIPYFLSYLYSRFGSREKLLTKDGFGESIQRLLKGTKDLIGILLDFLQRCFLKPGSGIHPLEPVNRKVKREDLTGRNRSVFLGIDSSDREKKDI